MLNNLLAQLTYPFFSLTLTPPFLHQLALFLFTNPCSSSLPNLFPLPFSSSIPSPLPLYKTSLLPLHPLTFSLPPPLSPPILSSSSPLSLFTNFLSLSFSLPLLSLCIVLFPSHPHLLIQSVVDPAANNSHSVYASVCIALDILAFLLLMLVSLSIHKIVCTPK